jgi:hypothetical protein
VNEVLNRLSAVRDELGRLVETEKSARNVVSDLKIQKAVIAKDKERAKTHLVAHERARDEAVRRLRLFAEKKLLEEAGLRAAAAPEHFESENEGLAGQDRRGSIGQRIGIRTCRSSYARQE